MDYTRTCWSCGKVTMVNKGSYFQCSKCGATYNELPKLGSFIDIESHRDAADGSLAYRPVRRRPGTGVGKR